MGEFKVHYIKFFEYLPKAIHCLAYDEVSDRLALSRSDGSIEIWSLPDKWYQEKIIHGSNGQSVEALVWSDGRLFSAGLHGYVHEYDLIKCLSKSSSSSNSGAIWCLATNFSGTCIAAGTEDGCVIIYSTTTEEIQQEKVFMRQEGRILSIAWYHEENYIVTGGIDNIRIWNVKSGQAVQRLTLPRQDKNKETIVWALAVTHNFTIVSGDSRGRTTFWNGQHGTVIKSFQSHKSAVLTLAINKAGTKVVSSGTDPTLIQFEYIPAQSESEWNIWTRTNTHSQHTHDVRAITFTNSGVVSGGIDCNLIYNSFVKNDETNIKAWCRFPAVPHHNLVTVCPKANAVMFRYDTYLDLWKLGATNRNSEKNGEILNLSMEPQKLLQLNSKKDLSIVSSAISCDASVIVYSDKTRMHFFYLNNELEKNSPQIHLVPIKNIVGKLFPAHLLKLSSDSSFIISISQDCFIQRSEVSKTEINVKYTIPHCCTKGIHLISFSSDDKYFAVGDHNNDVYIYKTKDGSVHCMLPHYSFQPTALSFHPMDREFIVAYSDQKIFEYDYKQKEYTLWCRNMPQSWHPQWINRNDKITHLYYVPNKHHLILAADGQMISIINKTEKFPTVKDKLIIGSNKPDSRQKNTHAFHCCIKYKYLLHVEPVAEDNLIIVERPPMALTEALPPPLYIKKFGT